MSKVKVAFFDFACCEGCQLQVANMGELLIDVLEKIEIVEFREAMLVDKGMGRVDFILTDEGFKVIEINTVPGLTEVSLFPDMAEESGISKTEMISMLLKNVL